jgi:hypothetical protein
LEREVLDALLASGGPAIVATAGSLVTDHGSYERLRREATTIWLKATPEDHFARVLAQGDTRPMQDRTDAMNELRALLRARGALCANAVHPSVELDEHRRSRKRGGETQRPRRSLSEAAVKKCGVAFPRPRVNGSFVGVRRDVGYDGCRGGESAIIRVSAFSSRRRLGSEAASRVHLESPQAGV